MSSSTSLSKASHNRLHTACQTRSLLRVSAGAFLCRSAGGKSKASSSPPRKKRNRRLPPTAMSSRTSSRSSTRSRGSRPCCSRPRSGSRTSISARLRRSCGFSCRGRAGSRLRRHTLWMRRRNNTSCSASRRIMRFMIMLQRMALFRGPRFARRCRSSRAFFPRCSKN